MRNARSKIDNHALKAQTDLKEMAYKLLNIFSVSLFFFLLSVGFAEAEGDAHHKAFNLTEEIFKFVNTLIVIGILYKLLSKPLKNFFHERREGIRKALEDTEKARVEAEKQLEEQRSKVADLEAELNSIRGEGKKELEKIRVKLEEDSELQAKRLLDQASNAIELEMSKALSEIQDEASKIAVDLAEDILKKNLEDEDQTRLSQEYLDKITDVDRS
ncbi:MAG: ATP synthase F0 subunit B [Nitrospinota bacterium]|nr:ATP synthase F0 subunit B [Nitrospinota bacterium]